MNYKFPTIETIDDVLPHIEGRDEFIVAERDFGTVINYQVAFEDTFPPVKVARESAKMGEEKSLANSMRRECRGLIFYPDGRIMSRPFHKFFNVGEREETLPKNVDIFKNHIVMDKMDGSMIRPVIHEGKIRLGTKMGITDISKEAEKLLTPDFKSFLEREMDQGYTPIFEYVSPSNRIVVSYDKARLVLIAIRKTVSGAYVPMNKVIVPDFVDKVSIEKTPINSIESFISQNRTNIGSEGHIISFEDGHMLKIKNDWYVRLHKALDKMRFDRNIVDMIIHNQLDDVKPVLDKENFDKLKEFEEEFQKAFKKKIKDLEILKEEAQTFESRKDIALSFVNTLDHPINKKLVWRLYDGSSAHDLLMGETQKACRSNTSWDAYKEWFYA